MVLVILILYNRNTDDYFTIKFALSVLLIISITNILIKTRMNLNAPQVQLARVNVHEVMERFRSKKELYDFLS
jgi:hypothetical protein